MVRRAGSERDGPKGGVITVRSGMGRLDTSIDVVKQDWDEAGLDEKLLMNPIRRAFVFHDNV